MYQKAEKNTTEVMVEQHAPEKQDNAMNDVSEKASREAVHVEKDTAYEANLVYDGDEEPEIHMRTWVALAAMFLLNLVQVFALQGPPAVVSSDKDTTILAY